MDRLVHRHDLRVRILDGRRLAVGLRLDSWEDDTKRQQVGTRLMFVGAEPREDGGGSHKRLDGPMSPDSPKPGDIGHGVNGEVAGVGHEEILTVTLPRAETVSEWAKRMNATPGARPTCGCGCGGKIVILPRHRSMGLPGYLPDHAPNGMSLVFERLRAKGHRFVTFATSLGVSATTLRRMEAEGTIPKARRLAYANRKDARVYTRIQVARMVRSRVQDQWRRVHPGRWK